MRKMLKKSLPILILGLLVLAIIGCGTQEKEKTEGAPATEQPKQELKVSSVAEMKELLPDSWPSGWTLFAPGYSSKAKPQDVDMMVNKGSAALFLGKGPLKYGIVPTQRIQITIEDLQDLNAEKNFKPTKEGTVKTPTGTVVYKVIMLNGHKAEVLKVPEMMNSITLTFCSGRFQIQAIGQEDEGTTLDDLKALCSALKLRKR